LAYFSQIRNKNSANKEIRAIHFLNVNADIYMECITKFNAQDL